MKSHSGLDADSYGNAPRQNVGLLSRIANLNSETKPQLRLSHRLTNYDSNFAIYAQLASWGSYLKIWLPVR